MNKVLVLAVHPDDETLGCGGTLLKHKAEGDKVYWLIATKSENMQRCNEKEIKDVTCMYNFDGVYKLGLPTMRVDEFPMKIIIDKISILLNEAKPNIIYLPFYNDVHSDHKRIFEAAFSCTKIFRYPFIKRVLMMEVVSETDYAPSVREFVFVPNYFVNITRYFNKKLEIMKIYKREIDSHPFPRNCKNIEALATLRGAMAGCDYAEGFVLLKEIQ